EVTIINSNSIRSLGTPTNGGGQAIRVETTKEVTIVNNVGAVIDGASDGIYVSAGQNVDLDLAGTVRGRGEDAVHVLFDGYNGNTTITTRDGGILEGADDGIDVAYDNADGDTKIALGAGTSI